MYRNSPKDRSLLLVAFEGQVLGLDPGTGEVRWEDRIERGGEVELLEQDGRLYASAGHRLVCLRYPSGERIFDVAVPGRYHERPALVCEGGRLFLAAAGCVTAFDLDGNVLWHNGLERRGVGEVAIGFPGNFRQADDRGAE